MSFFRNIFFPLPSRFKRLDTMIQNRVVLSVSLAGLVRLTIENELLPLIVDTIPFTLGNIQKQQIVTEMTLGIVSSMQMPPQDIIKDVWDLDREGLRQMIGMLVLAEADDARQVLSSISYSANPDEARVQTLLAVVRVSGSKDDTLITRLNAPAVAEIWQEITGELVSGAITGFKRAAHDDVVDRMAKKLGEATPRGVAIIEELIKRSNAQKPHSFSHTDASELLAPDSRTQRMYRKALAKAEELRDHILPWMELPSLELPEFKRMQGDMLQSWLQFCIPYTVNLLFLSQLKKDPYFAKGKTFAVIYGQALKHMVELDVAQITEMGYSDAYDPKKSMSLAREVFAESERALLFYINNYNKTPFPDTLMLEFMCKRIGVQDNLKQKFITHLRAFNEQCSLEYAFL